MCPPIILVAAGSAVLLLTTSIKANINLDLTAAQRAEVTRKLLAVIQKRHNHFLTELLPQIRPSCPDELALQEKLKVQTDLLLTSCQTRLNGLCETIDAQGMLSRLSPTFMKEEIARIRQELVDLDANTRTTTQNATGKIDKLVKEKQKEIDELTKKLNAQQKGDKLKGKEKEIKELLEGKRDQVTLYSEDTALGLAELKLSLDSISQMSTESTN